MKLEIDLDNPTKEQLDDLKKALTPTILTKLDTRIGGDGELTRVQMETLMVTHKVDGQDVTKSLWDWVQSGTKAAGAEAKLERGSRGLKFMEAFQNIQKAMKNKEIPTENDTQIVAGELDFSPTELKETFMEALKELPEDKGDAGPEAAKKLTSGSLTKETLRELVRKDPEFAGLLLSAEDRDTLVLAKEKQIEEARQRLAEDVKKAVDKNLRVGKIDDADIRGKVCKVLQSSVLPDAQRRIMLLGDKGTLNDYQREIELAVEKQASELEASGILSKAAPQPIILGGSAPGMPPIKVLPDEKIGPLDATDPEYADKFAKIMAQELARHPEAMGATLPGQG